MLGKFYSRSTSTVTNESLGTSTVEETFCIFEGVEDGPMILCTRGDNTFWRDSYEELNSVVVFL